MESTVSTAQVTEKQTTPEQTSSQQPAEVNCLLDGSISTLPYYVIMQSHFFHYINCHFPLKGQSLV